MGSKWIRMVVLGIISIGRQSRWSHYPADLPSLMLSSGISFCLASPHWVLSGTFACFMGAIWSRGIAFVGYTWVGRRDGSYVIDICVYCAGEEEKKWSHAFWFDCYCVDCVDRVDLRDCRPVLLSTWMISKDNCTRLWWWNYVYVSLCCTRSYDWMNVTFLK